MKEMSDFILKPENIQKMNLTLIFLNVPCIQAFIRAGTSFIKKILSKKITLVKLLEEIKSSSSKWIKTKNVKFSNFYWQSGYGAFSVNPTEIEVVKNYILNQEAHHKVKSFQDEYRAFLKKYEVDYNEDYVWD